MHESVEALVSTILSGGVGADSSVAVKTALIGAAGLVLAAVGPAVLGKKEREPKAVRDLRVTEQKLRAVITAQRDEEKKRADEAEHERDAARAEIERLVRLLLSQNPPISPYPPSSGPRP